MLEKPLVLPNIDRNAEFNNAKMDAAIDETKCHPAQSRNVNHMIGAPGSNKNDDSQSIKSMLFAPKGLFKDKSGASLFSLNAPSQIASTTSFSPNNVQPQPRMFFGNHYNNEDRVLSQMLDNMQRDQEVSLQTLLGNEQQVLNLRPLNKDKFLKPKGTRFRGNNSISKTINNTSQEDDGESKHKRRKTYFKTLETMILSSPRTKHEL